MELVQAILVRRRAGDDPNVADASRNRHMPVVLGCAGNAGDLLFHASRAKACFAAQSNPQLHGHSPENSATVPCKQTTNT